MEDSLKEVGKKLIEDQLLTSIAALEAERATLEADCDFANCRASECAEELSVLKAKLAEEREEIARLRGVLSEVTADTVYSDNEKLREEIARLRKTLEAIKHRGIPMTARDEYRRGFMEALSATRKVAVEALEASDG